VDQQVPEGHRDRIDMLTKAYDDAVWDVAITAAVEVGRLAVDVVYVATAAFGAG
jgi:hypothetical protein